jgi:hypothetical protein
LGIGGDTKNQPERMFMLREALVDSAAPHDRPIPWDLRAVTGKYDAPSG